MKTKIKMKRHESFSIREGWLVKGIKAFVENNKVFSASDATDILGIGTNMVKSLKYWLLATTLIEEKSKSLVITDFAKLLNKYDPYLEDVFSWWLIHINLNLNLEEAYIFNTFYNKCNSKTFSKKEIYELISEFLNDNNIEYNSKTLQDEISMVIKTYCIDETIDNPENNFICPLSDLNLLKKIDRETYEKTRPIFKDLNYLVVYYLMLHIAEDKNYISIDDLLKVDNGPAKLLNLDKNLINEYLDEMRRHDLIVINRTAGLNMIYFEKKLSLEDIMKEYYE